MSDDESGLGERPSMVGQPPTARPQGGSSLPIRRRRGRKPKNYDSDSEDQSGPQSAASTTDAVESSGTTAAESVDDQPSSPTNDSGPPIKKKRGRPADPNSMRSRKRRERELREQNHEKPARTPKRRRVQKLAKLEIEEEAEDEETETAPDQDADESEASPERDLSTPDMPDPRLRDYSALQLYCDFLLRKLMMKDPEEYFTYPVSASLAPGYQQVISTPMDFLTMRNKIEEDAYKTIADFRTDAHLIAENAMKYNDAHTVYYVAAQKLVIIVNYYFSEQYLEYLRYTLPFGRLVSREVLGLPEKVVKLKQIAPTEKRRGNDKVVWQSPAAKKLLAEAPPSLRKKLTTEVPKWHLGYVDNEDGALALNLVTTTESTKIKVGDIVGKLDSGQSGLLSQYEEAFPATLACSYLNYEPFASFAPMYDTTWAMMNQRDSDLLIQTYGSKENAADVMEIYGMVQGCGEHYLKAVDGMLDALTDGEHSKTMEVLRKSEEEEAMERLQHQRRDSLSPTTFAKMLDSIKTLENLGLDTNFVEDIKVDAGLYEDEHCSPEAALEQNAQGIKDLEYLQQRRFTLPVSNLADVPDAADEEVALVNRITTNFQQQIVQFQVGPGELISQATIHAAMGVNDDAEDEDDFDVLREFFDN